MFAAPAQQQPPISTSSSSTTLSQDPTVIDGEGFGVEQVANQDAVREEAREAREEHEQRQPISTSSSTTAVNEYISANKHATFSDLGNKFDSVEPIKPVNPEDPPPPPSPATERPYSAFSKSTKRLIVGVGALAAVFSPISSNIFVPAIPTLAEAFGRSESDISQAVTIYLVFQAITPSFFGSMSDSFGRRPLYIMTLVIYLGANIGLALMPTTQYWLLLFLRALQATGGSAVISIGYGCISDVAAPRERGKYAAVIQAGSTTGPALGPLIGGILTQTLGWRSVFWFLVIATCVALIPLVLFMPETLRSLVGDGSIPPPPLSTSPIVLIQKRNAARKAAAANAPPEPVEEIECPRRKPYQPFSTFAILATPEIICCFIFVSLLYLQYYCSLTLLSTALKDSYGLNEIKIGLAYLPLGLGSIISSQLNGLQLDYYYRKEESRVGGDYASKPHQFNTEWTRIRCLIPFAICTCLATIGQGWCLEKHVHLAPTLIFNFFVGLGSGTVGSITVYAQDVKPGKGGAVSAAFNLVRCMFAAIAVACVQTMYNAMGAGWTFVLLTGLVIAGSPLPIITVFRGKQWRDKRKEKKELKRVKKAEKLEEKQAGVSN